MGKREVESTTVFVDLFTIHAHPNGTFDVDFPPVASGTSKIQLDNVLVGIPIVDRVRWVFGRGKVVGVDAPGFVNTPAGASFRARMLSLGA